MKMIIIISGILELFVIIIISILETAVGLNYIEMAYQRHIGLCNGPVAYRPKWPI